MLKEYEPRQGYMYQLFARQVNTNLWESIDYAQSKKELITLKKEYSIAFPSSFEFKSVLLPKKYHPER